MANQKEKMVWRCQTCGYIYQDVKPPEECPICHNPKAVFRGTKLKEVTEKLIMENFKQHVKWVSATFYQFRVKLNPNKNIIASLARQELNNLKIHGQAYCPCRLRIGKPTSDRKIVCPCIFYPGEVENQGVCHCQLYFKE